jgi:xanthine dehydrogenase accessory factor
MAITLNSLLSALDWHVNLVDLSEFTSEMVDSTSIVVVATQGHGDEDAVEIALPKNPVYLGVVASRKRGEAVLAYLRDRSFSSDQLSTIKLPAGIDLGHTSHREMSVSILADLVQLRAAGAFKKQAPQMRKTLNMIEPEEVIDLVCGMTVQAVPANRPFTFEGTTYYFCAPVCRASFEKDPTSFIKQEAKC